ncbi:YqjK family protein [Pistricoccus aurantiacus]|uniref:YqjK family protein n=1 Tax=Pistricoccus aurantiacus TaxID=1883414 RepID=UPI001648482F|nr:YqjK family protein [Pistricoccus aurantiacus]
MNFESRAHRERRLRKAKLESLIEQQRIDLLVDSQRFREATSGIDHAWHTLMRWKVPLYGLGGLLVVRSARKPHSLRRWGQRAMAGAFLFQRIRKLLAVLR